MRHALPFAVALAILAGAASAQDRSAAIEDVISDQLQAFNDRDVEEAWSYASPTIQGLFGTPENFGMMVRQGYPMVWSNSGARFLELREFRGGLYQKVLVTDGAGRTHVLDYKMLQTGDGWEIDGVSIIPAPGVGA